MTDDELSAILKRWKVAPAPPSLETRVFSRRPQAARRSLGWAAGAVAATVAIGLGVWIMHDRRPPDAPAPKPSQPHPADVNKEANKDARNPASRPPVLSVPGRARDSGVPPLKIDAKAADGKLLESPPAVYPEAARAAGIQGTVKLQVVIGKDGRVVEAMVISGNQLLAPAAIEAVNRRLYRSTLLNGQPVELVTEVEVNFRLQ
ncbi:MAG TPA: TonB family protein [Candidatus Acidoferrales bacterium]|jgi:TonB family protein|nr:TonB family protein [Candidatus Acidoferrales bacterium]